MGKYSDSDNENDRRKRSKKKKRSRSRSRSYSSDASYSSRSRLTSSYKHKKKKSKHSKSSRSRRSRSRSRSRDRRRRSRSDSRSRRSRSRSYDKRRSRRSRSRSRSRDRRRSRSSSNSRSSRNENSRSGVTSDNLPVTLSVENLPGFDDMTPLEKNEARMQLALKAADLAAERLKAQGVLEGSVKTDKALTAEENNKLRKAIQDIEKDTFKQSQFKSSAGATNTKKLSVKQEVEMSHDSAMFGLSSADISSLAAGNVGKSIVIKDDLSLLAPVFFEDEEKKMDRWREKLAELRRQLDPVTS